jgi:topoisomerase-4 subunit A
LPVAYLNIDEVIQIIRQEDKPKEALMKAFKITELQSNAILDLRLRQLAKIGRDQADNRTDGATE